MTGKIKRKLYVCCADDKKDFYNEKVKTMMEGLVTVVDQLDECNVMYVIGDTTTSSMREEIIKANDLYVDIHYVEENLINKVVAENVIAGKYRVQPKSKDFNKGLER